MLFFPVVIKISCGLYLFYRKKKIQSSVWQVRDHYYDRKKKVPVVCLAGAQSLLRPENKKVPVVCLAGCAVVSVFGSGDTGKKSSSHLSAIVIFVLVQLELNLI